MTNIVVLDEADPVDPQALGTPEKRLKRLQSRIQQLRETGLFDYVEPDYLHFADAVPNDAAFGNGTLWGLRNQGQSGGLSGADIDAVRAWDITTGSTDVIVAVIDTGIRYTHQDLSAQMWRNPGESGVLASDGIDNDNDGFIDNVYGINAITGSGNPMDDNGHGTHCAGTIGAAANGAGPHVGVAWNVRLMALKFMGSGGSGYTSDAIECINFAVDKGARVLSCSWGGGAYETALKDAIVRARNNGVLVVTAAGNETANSDVTPHYPSGYDVDNVLSVAALDRSDNLAAFSNYGAQSVDLGAPGVDIYSTYHAADDSYAFSSGTSMATPHVAGVAALVIARFPGISVFDLRQRILGTTVPVSSLNGRSTTGGRLNAYNALTAAADGNLEVSVNANTTLIEGQTVTLTVTVTDLTAVANATVTGSSTGLPGINFRNDGISPDTTANDYLYSATLTVPGDRDQLVLSIQAAAPSKTTRTITASFPIVRASANDNFSNAVELTGHAIQATGNNQISTRESGEPRHDGLNSGGKSVWWKWTAPSSGTVTINTRGSSFDTLLGIYTGNAVNSLTAVAQNDDEVPGQLTTSRVQFAASAGTTYRIAVDGYNPGAGAESGSITLNLMAPPANDQFAGRTTVTGNSWQQTGSNLYATKETGEPNHAGNAGGQSIWWTWTAPANGAVALNTTGSGFDTLLAVYTGSSASQLTTVASNDDSPTELTSRLTFNAVSGTSYQIAVDGKKTGASVASGSVTLSLSLSSTPALTSISNVALDEGQLLNITLTATDPDTPSQNLVYALVNGPLGMSVTSGGRLTWVPLEGQGPGSYSVTASVSDGISSGTGSFIVTVREVNVAPTLTSISNQTLTEGQTLSLTLSASDTDLPPQTLTFAKVSGPSGLNVTPAGALTWTPTEAQGPGTYTVEVSVSDGTASTTGSFTVTVTEVNVAPTLTSISNQTLSEGQTLSLTLSASDTDLPAQTLTFARVSGPSGLTVTPAGALTWTPTEAQGPGTYTVEVSVSDGTASTTGSFTVTVTEVNVAPTLTSISNQTLSEGQTLSLTLSASDSDLPPQTLTFAKVSGPSGLTVTPAGALTWTPTEAQGPGTYTVEVSVSDGTASTTGSFTVTVTEINVAPTLTSISNQTLSEGQTLSLTLSASDSDLPPQTLTFAKVSGPSGLTVTPAGALTWTPAEAQGPGTYTVEVSVSDGTASTTGSFTVTVTEVNVAPTLTSISNQTLSEGQTLSLTLSASDTDLPPQTLTFAKVSGPSGLTVTPAGALTWTPTEAQGPGTYTVEVSVSDGTASTTGSFTVTVTEVNVAPTLTSISNQTLSEGQTLSLTLSASDTDLPAQTLTFARVSGPSGLTVTPAGALTWTPTEAQGPGTYTVEVSVSDGTASTTGSFTVTVTEVNVAPTLTSISNQTLSEGQTLSLTLSASDSDLPPQTLTFAKVSGPSGLTVTPAGALTWTPTEAQGPGTYTVEVSVSDGTASTTGSFTVTVTEVNVAPVLAAISDQTLDEGQTLSLTLSASDADLPAQDLTFSLTSGPDGMTVTSAGALTWTPTEAQGPSTNAVTVTVSDGVTSASRSFTVVVREVNVAPVLAAISDQTLDEGQTLSLTLSASDADLPDQDLMFSLTSGPDGMTVTSAGALTWTPTEAQGPSTNAVSVAVSDGVTSASRSFTVVVREVNVAPVLAAISDQTLDEGQVLSLSLSASDADLPAQDLTFSLTSGPDGMTVTSAGALTWTPTEAQGPSTNAVTVTVSDGVTSASRSFTVVVREVNVAPVLAAISDQTLDEGQTLSLTLSASDADLPDQDLMFSLTSGPDGMTVTSAGALTWTPTEAQGPSTNAVSVAVSDGVTSASRSFTVVVREVNVAPVLAAISDQTLDEGQVLSLTLSASDSDLPPQTLTFARVSGPNGMTVTSAGALTWTPTEAQGPSTNAVTVTVSDGVTSASRSFTVVVREVNVAPVLAAISDQTLDEGQTLSLTLSASDADLPDQDLMFSLTSGPDGMTVTSAGALTWTPTEAQGPSTNAVSVAVSDGVTSASRSFTVVVREVNVAPVLAAISDQTLDEGQVLSLTLSASDSDLPPQTLTFARVSGPNGLTVTPTGALTWTPTEAQGPGTYTAEVSVSDGTASTAGSFTVTVTEVNVAPVLAAISDQTLDEGQVLSLSLSASDTDLPTQTLTFAKVSGPEGLTVTPAGALTWTPTEAQAPDTYTVEVSVSDGTATTTGSFTVTVTEVNVAPTLAAIPDQTLTEGQVLSLTLSASDTDLPTQTLTFARVSGPEGLTVTPAGALSWTPTEAEAPATYTVEVSVSDGTATTTGSFTVTVTEVNVAPTLAAIPDQTLTEGQVLSLTLSASDTDLPTQTLTFAKVSGPEGLTVTPAGALTWTPTEAQAPDTYTVEVSVSDGTATTIGSFTVTVTEVNVAPTLAAIPDQTLTEGQVLSLTLSASDTDLPTQTLTFAKVSGPEGLTVTPAGALTWTPTEAQAPDTYTVEVSVSDGTATTIGSFTVTVTEVNVAPVLAAIPDQNLTEGQVLSLTLSASDSDLPTQTLTFAKVSGPEGLTVTPAGALSWTPTEAEAPATYTVEVSVSDGTATTAGSFTVTVTEVNVAPVLAAIPDQNLTEGQVLSLTLSASDSDLPPQTLTFAKVSGPEGLTVTPAGALSWTPTEAEAPATYTVEVSVSDGTATTAGSFTVTVTEVNVAPVLAAIPDQNLTEGQVLSLTLSASDSDLPPQTLTFAKVSGPDGLTVTPAGALTWTPTEAQAPDTYTVEVSVSDGTASTAGSFTVAVTEVNVAPVLAAIPDQTLTEGQVLSLTLSASDTDLPPQTLTFARVSGPEGLTVTPAGALSWTPTEAEAPATYTVEVSVSDGTATTAGSFSVTVTEVNVAPTLAAIPDQTLTEGQVLSLTLSASDTDLPPQTLTFARVSGPEGLTVTPAGALSWTPTEAEAPATYTVEVSVSDGTATTAGSFTVTVTEVNVAPTLAAIPDQTLTEGQVLSLTLSASDTDLPTQTLTFAKVSGPEGLTVTPAGALTWTPTEAQAPDTYTVEVSVSDGTATTTGSFTVTVTEVNVAPTLAAIPDQTLTEGQVLSLTLSASDTDLPPQTLTFTKVSGPDGLTVTPAGLLTWTPTEAEAPGTYPVTVSVSDGTATTTGSFTVTVTEVNVAPTLAAIPDQTLTEGQVLSLTLSASDTDLPPQTLTFTKVSGPNGLTVTPAGLLTWTPTEAEAPGTYPVTVSVSDGTATTTGSFTVTVTEVNVAPTLAAIPDQTLTEGQVLSLTLSASDTDLPPQTLTFAKVSGPEGLTVTPAGALSWTPTEAEAPATYTVEVSVSDGTATTAGSFTVTVTEVNVAPVLAAIPDQNLTEGQVLSLTLSASDSDLPPQTLTFAKVSGPDGLTVTPAGALSWTPTEAEAPGTYPVEVSVSDVTASTAGSFTVTVTEVNVAPTLAAIPDQTLTEGQVLSLTLSASDSDLPPQTLTFAKVSGPEGLTVTPAGALSWTPTEAQGPGTYTVEVSVSDGTATTTGSFTVTVTEVNVAPVLAAIPDQNLTEGQVLSLTLSASDSDLPPQTLTFTKVSGPDGLTVTPAGLLTWTPTEAEAPGTYPVTVSVSDGTATTTGSFTVTVTEVNVAPTLAAIPDQSLTEGQVLSLTLSASDTDLPTQTLTFTKVSGPNGLTVTPAGALTWTPTEAEAPGTYTVEVSVSDGTASTAGSFTVTVTEVNAAPTLTTIPDQNLTEGQVLSLTLSASDSDLPPQTLTFTKVSGPNGLTVTPAGALTWPPTEAEAPGTYTVEVSVSDGTASTAGSFTVTVTEVNVAPTLAAIPDQTLTEGQVLSLTLSASDSDLPPQTLTFTKVSGPDGLTVTPAGLLTWTPTEAEAPGTYPVTVSVSDGTATTTGSFTVTVTEVNVAPTLAAIPDQTLTEGQVLSLTLSASDTDLPTQTLTFTKVSGPNGLTVTPAGALTWTPTEAEAPGTYTVEVSVSDGTASTAGSFTVTVTEVNVAPTLTSISNQTLSEGQTLSLTLSASDTDLPAQTLTFARVSGPSGLTVTPAGALTWTPTEAQGPGTYTVEVSVSDGTASTAGSFTVTVTEVNVAPTLAAIPDQTLTEGQVLSLTLSASDTDLPPQTLTLAKVSGPDGLTVTPAGLLTWTPTEAEAPGTYTVEVSVSDGTATTAGSFSVTVTEVNVAPTLAAIPDQTLTEGQVLSLTLSASDTDLPTQTLTFTKVSGPNGLTVTPAGALTWTPTEAEAPGTYTVEVSVSDGTASTAGSFTVTVTEVNAAPTLTTIPDQNLTEGQTLSLTLSASDADLPAQDLTFSLTSGPTGMTITSAGILTWTPTESQGPSTNAVSVAVSDGVTSASRSFTVVVREVNVAPVLAAIPDQTLDEGQTLNLTLSASDADLPAQDLTFSLTSGPAGMTVTSAGALTWTPTEAQGPSTNAVAVAVSDGVTSASRSFTVVVREVNVAPVLAAIPDQTLDEGQTLNLTLSASDTDLPTQTLTFAKVSGPEGLTVTPAGALSWTPTEAEAPGTYTVTVSVSDGTASTTGSFTVTVLQSSIPIALSGTAIDGYIAGGFVWFDSNLNGVLDPSEPSSTTDRRGSFSLAVDLKQIDKNKNGQIDLDEGRLILEGGLDLGTGEKLRGRLTAPPGSTVVTPLTTLVDSVARQPGQGSIALAESTVLRALGLPEVPLTRFDPLEAALDGDFRSATIQSASAQIADTTTQIVTLLQGLEPSTDPRSGMMTVTDFLTQKINDGQSVALSSPELIRGALQASAQSVGIQVSETLADRVVDAISQQNALKEEAALEADPLGAIHRITQVQTVVQSEVVHALGQLGADPSSIDRFTIQFTGEMLVSAVEQAPVGDLNANLANAGEFSLANVEAQLTESGAMPVPLAVVRRDGASGIVFVDVLFDPPTGLKTNLVRLRFADGEIRKVIEPSQFLDNDEAAGPTRSPNVRLVLPPGSAQGARLGNPMSGRVEVMDDDAPGAVAFSKNRYVLSERPEGQPPLVIERRDGSSGQLTLKILVQSATAQAGVDYVTQQLVVTFGPGELLKILPPLVLDDSTPEPEHLLRLTLEIDPQSPPGARVDPYASTAEVIVVDDDLAPRLEWAPQSDGSIQLLGFGPEGALFDIQSSQDLRSWQTHTGQRITTLGFDKGTPISSADLSGTGLFYRLLSP